jgi:tRNA (guanine-N7-)-methyltransferase
MSDVKPRRKIKSFVKRSGRLSKAQAIGLNELWNDYGINLNGKLLNFEELFLNRNNVTVEVGFGNGDTLLEMAIQQPNQNFLGIEVYEAGVGRLINEASKNKLTNLKIIKDEAV